MTKGILYFLMAGIVMVTAGCGNAFNKADDETSLNKTCYKSNGCSGSDGERYTGNGFITVWKTDNTGGSDDNQIALPLTVNGNYTFTVYWGDGTEDTITSPGDSAVVHTYAVSGTYEVIIEGTIEGWSFGNNGDPQKLVQVKAWGPLKFGNTSGQFYGCKAMIITATDKPDLSDTSSLANAFRGCYALTAIPSLNEWDTSGVTDMSSMFEYTCFNQAITGLDASKVTNMSRMFYEARKFNRNITDFDTSQVVDMSEMFYDANVFNQDISDWNTSNVQNMNGMFRDADAFNRDISSWKTSNVTDMGNMFMLAKKFNQPIGSWDTANVTDMSFMFRKATAFDQDISEWNTANVETMQSMFSEADTFSQDLSKWTTSKVTNMSAMFWSADKFDQDISAWDTSNVTDMSDMFSGALAFNHDISSWKTGKVTSMAYMFYYSNYNQDLSSWDISSIATMANMFRESALTTVNYDAMLISWKEQASQRNIVNVVLGSGDVRYSAGDAAEAREALVNVYEWYISDSGLAVSDL